MLRADRTRPASCYLVHSRSESSLLVLVRPPFSGDGKNERGTLTTVLINRETYHQMTLPDRSGSYDIAETLGAVRRQPDSANDSFWRKTVH